MHVLVGAAARRVPRAGGEWPGGEQFELTDLLEMLDLHPCRQPWDPSKI